MYYLQHVDFIWLCYRSNTWVSDWNSRFWQSISKFFSTQWKAQKANIGLQDVFFRYTDLIEINLKLEATLFFNYLLPPWVLFLTNEQNHILWNLGTIFAIHHNAHSLQSRSLPKIKLRKEQDCDSSMPRFQKTHYW